MRNGLLISPLNTPFALDLNHRLVRGLVAFVPGWEGSGPFANDISGKGNHCEFVNDTSWEGSQEGFAIRFGEVANDHATFNKHLIDTGNPMTYSVWCRRFNDTVTGEFIQAGTSQSRFRSNSDGSFLYRTNGDVTVTPTGLFNLAAGWANMAVTFDGAVVRLYFNGREVANETKGANNSAGAAHTLSISGTGLEAVMKDVRIYDRALSPNEMMETYLNPNGVYEI